MPLPLSVNVANAGRFDAAKTSGPPSASDAVMITSVVAPSFTVWLPIGLSTGGRLTSITRMVNVSLSTSGGTPLSAAVTVTVYRPASVYPGVSVSVAVPFPLSTNEANTSGGDNVNAIGLPLGSHAVMVSTALAPSFTVTSPMTVRIGGSWANGP